MNAISLLTQDHRNVDALFTRFEALGEGHHAEKRQIVDKVIEQLARHSQIEETIFYPAADKAVSGTHGNVLESLEEHHLMKATLNELEKLQPTNERFDAKVKVLIENVRHHVEEEENDFFPKVEQAMPPARLEELGNTMASAKTAVPNRPHPLAPDTPPWNVLIGVPVAVADRVFSAYRQAFGRLLNR